MLTIGYVRVSTDRQAEQGVSLEAQEAKIRAMARAQGSELIDVIVDGCYRILQAVRIWQAYVKPLGRRPPIMTTGNAHDDFHHCG